MIIGDKMDQKKADQCSSSLQNCSIAIATNTIPQEVLGDKMLSAVKKEIYRHGGKYVPNIAKATHLVVTRAQFDKRLVKVQKALENTEIRIVSFDWLETAFRSMTVVSESPYLFSIQEQCRDDISKAGVGSMTDTQGVTSGSIDGKGRSSLNSIKISKDKVIDQADDPLPNITKNLDLNIPLDENIPASLHGAKVFIREDGTIFDATLNYSNVAANANKFYRVQLLEDRQGTWSTWTHWGRVGEKGQTKLLGPGTFKDAFAYFIQKFKDKTGNEWDDRHKPARPNKYVFIEKTYEHTDNEEDDDDDDNNNQDHIKPETMKEEEDRIDLVESELPLSVQSVVKLIFNQEHFIRTYHTFDYDSQKMPLGKLSKDTIMRAYQVLKKLAAAVDEASDYHQITELSNQYFSVIPHVVSRSSRPPVLDNLRMIQKEVELMETLTNMQLANDFMKGINHDGLTHNATHILDRLYRRLRLQEITPLDSTSSEFRQIQIYFTRSIGSTHGIQYIIRNVFRIERLGEIARFGDFNTVETVNSDRRLLWHGSRCVNFGGILSQGLRIAPPEVPSAGYMFGKGIYLADMSSKSANYCQIDESDGIGLLLLCEAELGTPSLKLTSADFDAGRKAAAQGSISTWGVGITAPRAWKDASCIHEGLRGVLMPDVGQQEPGPTNEADASLIYNEYICYNVQQVRLRYLLKISI